MTWKTLDDLLADISVRQIKFEFADKVKKLGSKSLAVKATETRKKNKTTIDARIELVVAEARKRQAAEIAKAERGT